jgi:hypothetical protein
LPISSTARPNPAVNSAQQADIQFEIARRKNAEIRPPVAVMARHIDARCGAQQRSTPMNKILSAICVAGLIASATGFAVLPAAAAEMDFTKIDANGDGKVDMKEAKAAGWKWTDDQFKKADADGDGSLNAEEFKVASLQQ